MWQLNIWQFKNHQRRLQSPAYIKELQVDLMKWAVKREEKGLDTRSLDLAINYLNDYRKICSRAEMVREEHVEEGLDDLEFPEVKGYTPRL